MQFWYACRETLENHKLDNPDFPLLANTLGKQACIHNLANDMAFPECHIFVHGTGRDKASIARFCHPGGKFWLSL